MIWVKYAYNVIFNFGPCVENVTDLKIKLSFLYGAFKCQPASEPLAHNLDSDRAKISCIFNSSEFRDFLEKYLQFFNRYLMGISKYIQNVIR